MICFTLTKSMLLSIATCSLLLSDNHFIQLEGHLEDQYNSAKALYENSKTQLEALQIFKNIVTKDSSAYFWKSYVYIANIYLRLKQVDSALKILEYGEKRISSLPRFHPKGDILGDLHAYRSEVSPDSLLDLQKERKRMGFDDITLDTPPEPIGGLEEIQRNIKYPEDAFQKGIEDTVFVSTHISWRGDVCETQILKGGKTPSLMEAAREAIYKIRWRPAKHRDLPLNVWVPVRVKFRLK